VRVIHLNCYESLGGAARAAFRIHESLVEIGVDSSMRVAVKSSDDFKVVGPTSKIGKALALVRPTIGQLITGFQHTDNNVLHSCSFLPSGLDRELNSSNADLVNMHWIAGEMVSVAEIGRITKPIVWTLHDMWPFCGAEHFESEHKQQRFVDGYQRNNRAVGDSGWDIDRWVWRRKLRNWKRPMTIVAPSRWLANHAKNSVLFRNCRVEAIPNAINTQRWKPLSQALARKWLGLPLESKLVLFGAIGGSRDQRKGGDLLVQALAKLRNVDGVRLVVFGETNPEYPPDYGLPAHYLGHLHDDISLAIAYSACDVMVVPSRQDNLPNTAVEAAACGVPVVAFRIGGLPDIVDHMQTGYLASPFDVGDLAQGVSWVLEEKERRLNLCANSRRKAEEQFSYPVVARRYRDLYEDALRCGR